jgi:dihydropteroate synthase
MHDARIGPTTFRWGARTYLMGIVNATPDSFAGDGTGDDPAAAAARARQLVAEGADLIDVGGESTRPGATPVDTRTELARVLPVIERLAGTLPVPLSIDTTKPAVAEAALAAGAVVLNDIFGLRREPAMAHLAARHAAAVVVMANLRGQRYDDVVTAVLAQLRASVAIARAAGLPPERVIVDPGFGFGPTPAENLELVRRLGEFRALGCPVLLGPSRKSTIGAVLDLPVEERLEGTAAVVALAIARGVDVVRVHDVRAMARVARMADALVRGWPGPATEAATPAGGAALPAVPGAARR